jgi:leucyl aminopeptidase
MAGNYSTIVSVVAASTASCDTTMVLVTAEALDALGLPAAQATDFGAKSGAVTTVYGDKRVFAVGIGPAADVTSESLRSAVTAGVKALKAAKATAADIVLPAGLSLSANRTAADVTLAAVLADYSFDIYINDEERKFHIETLSVISDAGEAVEMAYKVAKGQCAAKDLANTRAGVATPQYMEDRAAQLVSTQTIRRFV